MWPEVLGLGDRRAWPAWLRRCAINEERKFLGIHSRVPTFLDVWGKFSL